MPNKYKVFFHDGQEIGLKTSVLKGKAWIDEFGLKIEGRAGIRVIPATNIKEVEMFRLHGMARVIRVDHTEGRLFLAVVRFMIGQFASVNFFKTGELHTSLKSLTIPNGSPPKSLPG